MSVQAHICLSALRCLFTTACGPQSLAAPPRSAALQMMSGFGALTHSAEDVCWICYSPGAQVPSMGPAASGVPGENWKEVWEVGAEATDAGRSLPGSPGSLSLPAHSSAHSLPPVTVLSTSYIARHSAELRDKSQQEQMWPSGNSQLEEEPHRDLVSPPESLASVGKVAGEVSE